MRTPPMCDDHSADRVRREGFALWFRIHDSALLIASMLFLAACSSGGSDEGDGPERPVVGREAPGFTLEDSQGGAVSLSDFTSTRPVLLYAERAACCR